MESRYGFTRMTVEEFSNWINNQRIGRTVLTIQQHHTYSPDYSGFTGDNHFTLQKSMKNYHVNHNGWSDLGQHFTTFTDGTIVTGRSLESSPACIYGNNANSICIEHLGNFDINRDTMTDEQSGAITDMTAALCIKFSISPDPYSILYHHWFKLSSGERNNGRGGNKSCPGSAFFGGNKVEDFEANFLPPLIRSIQNTGKIPSPPQLIKHASVTASKLNVRTGPGANNSKAADRDPLSFGSIIRIYEEKDNWYRISSSKDHWVSARYTRSVKRAVVNASRLNARTGPDVAFNKVGSYLRDQVIFIEEESGNWGKISNENKWVSLRYLSF